MPRRSVDGPSFVRRTRGGFTLVELLVTIGVIALLIGILLPVLGSARAAARATVCLANMRSVITAVHTFSVDNNGRFPPNRQLTQNLGGGNSEHDTWRGILAAADYLAGDADNASGIVGDYGYAVGVGAEAADPGERTAWTCPAAPEPALREAADGPSICRRDVASNFAYNGNLTWQSYPLKRSKGFDQLTIVRDPSATIALAETRCWWPDLRDIALIGRGRYPGDPAATDEAGYFGFWHPGAVPNWAFNDSSVRAIAMAETIAPLDLWAATDKTNTSDWLLDDMPGVYR